MAMRHAAKAALLLTSVSGSGSNDAGMHRVVGYVPSYRSDCVMSLDYSALTHVIASFLDPWAPDSPYTENLKSVISYTKTQDVSVFVSIGGGGSNVSMWLTKMSAENADASAQKIVDSALELGVDGIDVDLEGDLVLGGSYNSFVATLASKAQASNLGLSAALAKWTCSQAISDDTLALYDFVNLMAYDYKGSWDTSEPLSDFSSFDVAKNELDYYMDTRGLPGSKVTIGVPFYGYDFSDKANVTSFTWAEIASSYPEQADNDDFDGKYYNGRKTILAKTQLAKSRGAGMMIWELGQDVHSGEYSLLQQIKSAYLSDESVIV